MRACSYCGQDVSDKAVVCPKCKRPITAPAEDAFPELRGKRKRPAEAAEAERRAQEALAPDDPEAELIAIEKKNRYDFSDRHRLAAAAYTGILFFIPLKACKNREYAIFHANQGLVILLLMLADILLYAMVTEGRLIATLCAALSGGLLYLMVLGAIRAFMGKMIPLPIIGGIHILKYDPKKQAAKN